MQWELRLEGIAGQKFTIRTASNHEELSLYNHIRKRCGKFNQQARSLGVKRSLSAHTQVCLRQIVEPVNEPKWEGGGAVCGLSLDFVVMNGCNHPQVVFEHRGSGHYGSGSAAADRVAAHDLIKEEVLRSAGIRLVVSGSEAGSLEAAADCGFAPLFSGLYAMIGGAA